MSGRLSRFLFAPVIGLFLIVSQNSQAETPAVLEALNRPGVHAIMRHAIAPGTGDPASFKLGDCSTQRNLDDRGREQARAIGRAFRAAGVVFDRVLTSQWCRCRETAELVDMGGVMEFPALNSFFRDRSTRGEQTGELSEFIGALPEGEKVLFVTHQVNVTALTGRGVASGEVFLIRMDESGRIEVVGEFLVHP